MTDVVIIGAGVIGLAIGREISAKGLETIILEKENRAGDATSSRNSGVIHAGMYYPETFLKSILCVQGNTLLYEYANEKNITHKKFGKYIIATKKEEEPHLETIYNQGLKNKVKLTFVSKEEILNEEPHITCEKGLFSPNSGVIDVPEYVSALEGDIQHSGSYVSFKTNFLKSEKIKGKFIIHCDSGDPFTIESKYLINCSGLNSDEILKKIEGFPKKLIKKINYAKGHYFKYSGQNPFSRLIYPISGKFSLGIHVGFDLSGGLRFGPDLEWTDKINYEFNESLKSKFIDSISSYWPDIDQSKLHPDYTGIRPKIQKKDDHMKDFCITSSKDHGLENFINLQGIESPGLTSSLAIGKLVGSFFR